MDLMSYRSTALDRLQPRDKHGLADTDTSVITDALDLKGIKLLIKSFTYNYQNNSPFVYINLVWNKELIFSLLCMNFDIPIPVPWICH